MRMREIHSERRLCTCCMEEHEVKTVRVMEHTRIKNVPVEYEAVYLYCEAAEELFADEGQIQENDVAAKDAYRRQQGLFTSEEIRAVRRKYDISQSDLCVLLGWGGKTVTRYESHQIQDRAHDTILRKLDQDPEWFLDLLENVRDSLAEDSYHRCFQAATNLYEKDQDLYLRKAIEARYARFHGNQLFHGNAALSLDKVVDVIRYFAAAVNVTNLYKVKLMKLMWYGDALSYKKRGHAITGLVYQALPMGAVPIGHDSIIDLRNVPCEEVDMGETYAYRFHLQETCGYPSLNDEDMEILNMVIDKLGRMTKDEIVAFMHKEQAYTETAPRDIITFAFAENLQI